MGKFIKRLTSVWSLILIISILLFVFWGGPVLSASALGHSGRLIVSYSFIPIAVAAVLLWRKNWEWATFAYYTLGIALIKMVITMGLFVGASPRRAVGNAKAIDTVAGSARQESAYKQVGMEQWGTLIGQINSVSSTNNLMAAIANISSGKSVERRVHKVSISNQSVSPRFLTATVGDRMEVTNHDGDLHTFNVTGVDGAFLQLPLAPGKTTTPQLLSKPGYFTSHCAQGHPDELLRLWVLSHPYHTIVMQDGKFALDSIPPGRYRVGIFDIMSDSVHADALATSYADFDISAGDTVTVELENARNENVDSSR